MPFMRLLLLLGFRGVAVAHGEGGGKGFCTER